MRALAMLERLAGHVADSAQAAQLSEALLPLAAIKTVRCACARCAAQSRSNARLHLHVASLQCCK